MVDLWFISNSKLIDDFSHMDLAGIDKAIYGHVYTAWKLLQITPVENVKYVKYVGYDVNLARRGLGSEL